MALALMVLAHALPAAGPARAQGAGYDAGLVGADLLAYNYFRTRFKAYYITSHAQERAGDTYVLRAFRPVIPRERCFDIPRGPEVFDQAIGNAPGPNQELRFRVEIEGKWAWSAAVSIEVEVRQEDHVKLQDVASAEITDDYRRAWRAGDCPWLADLFQRGLQDGKHLLIHGMVYARGRFESYFELTARAGARLDAEQLEKAVAAVKERLRQYGIARFVPDARLKIALEGSVARSRGHVVTFREPTPAAFIPAAVNRAAMDRYLAVFLYEGRDEELERAIRSPQAAAAFLNEYPDFVIPEGELSPLLRRGEAVALDPKDKEQEAARDIDLKLILANALARLQREPEAPPR